MLRIANDLSSATLTESPHLAPHLRPCGCSTFIKPSIRSRENILLSNCLLAKYTDLTVSKNDQMQLAMILCLVTRKKTLLVSERANGCHSAIVRSEWLTVCLCQDLYLASSDVVFNGRLECVTLKQMD